MNAARSRTLGRCGVTAIFLLAAAAAEEGQGGPERAGD